MAHVDGGRASGWDEIAGRARASEPDRYLAALLSPKPARDDLITLAAFAAEVRRIPLIVSDPHLAEIRLRWWRDAVLSGEASSASGHAAADRFRNVVARHALPVTDLETWFDALAHTYYAAAPEDEAHLALEHELIEGTLFRFAARIAGAVDSAVLDAAMRNGAIAYGLARLGLDFPHILARGRVPLPGFSDETVAPADIDALRARVMLVTTARAHFAAVAQAFPQLDAPARAVLLPVALVEPYLRALEKQGHDLKRDLGDVAPLVRVWRIWRAHRRRRLG